MRISSRLGGFILLGGLVLPSSAAPPEKAPSPAARLIELLGDDDYRQRVQASEALRKMGTTALPELNKALSNPDTEVRRRVVELIPLIETEAYVAPRRVTLRVRNAPLAEIFEEIHKQTGYKVEFWTKGSKQGYSFHFRDLTFWEAIDRIGQETNLVMQQQINDGRVTLQQQEGHIDHVSHWGAFRFVPVNLQHCRNIQFGPVAGPQAAFQRNESLTLTFNLFSEPRLPMLGLGEVRLLSAYDSDGNSMLGPPGQQNYYQNPWGGRIWRTSYGGGNMSHCMQTQIQLQRPSERASRIKEARGVVPVTLVVEQKPVVVTDKFLSAKGTKVTVGTTTFQFENITQPNKNQLQYQVQLSISEDNKDNPNDYSWMSSIYQRIELQDEKGNKYMVFGTNWGNNGVNHVQMTLTYGTNGNASYKPPSKFIFHHWKTLQHNIHFTLTDLPLP